MKNDEELSKHGQPTFLSIAPRFRVKDLTQALTFYEQLGFEATYRDENFAMIRRDEVELHLNYHKDIPRKGNYSVCWIGVIGIDALYQEYLSNNNPVRYPLETKPWGIKEFAVCDPFGNLIIITERIDSETWA